MTGNMQRFWRKPSPAPKEAQWTCCDRADPLRANEAEIMPQRRPYEVPASLPAGLNRLLGYWNKLKRGNAEMPFADDVTLGAIPDVGDRALLIDVFANPLRFRFAEIGAHANISYDKDLAGRFVDQIDTQPPLDFLLSQACATAEGHAPTYHQGTDAKGKPYHRLLLPLWADGHVAALLGAVVG